MTGWRLVWEWGGARGTAVDIDPQWTETASLYDSVSRRQVEVSFRPRGLSVAAMVEAGAHPYSGFASLYMGDRLIISSRWVEASYGQDGDPLSITLSESPDDDRGLWPPIGLEQRAGWDQLAQKDRARRLAESGAYTLTGQIDATAWPGANSSAIGQSAPIVIGSPGSTTAPAVPAYAVLSAHPFVSVLVSGTRAAGSVRVWGNTTSGGSTPTIVAASSLSVLAAAVDGYGSQVAKTTINASSLGLDYSDSVVYATSWESASGLPGGAGDLMQIIAAASGARLDTGSFGACASFFNRYRFDGYFDQRAPALALLQRQLLPLLPGTLVSGSDGVALVVWPWVDGGHYPVSHLVEGPTFARASAVTYRGEPLSSLVMSYGYDIGHSTYTRRLTVTPDVSAPARVAMVFAGDTGTLSEVESRMVWDEASAARMMTDRVAQLAMPRRQVSYIADPRHFGAGGARELQVGMAVDLTDAGLRLSRRAAVVSGIERSATSLRVTCTLRDSVVLSR